MAWVRFAIGFVCLFVFPVWLASYTAVQDAIRERAASSAVTDTPPPNDNIPPQPRRLPPNAVHRVMSWNILAHEYTAYNTPSGTLESSAQRDRRWLLTDAYLGREDADIVCLQEVTPSFLAQSSVLANATGDAAYAVEWAPRSDRSEDGLVIAARRDRYERVVAERHTFVNAKKPRISLAALYRVRSPPVKVHPLTKLAVSQYLLVVNVHLEGDPTAVAMRRAQMHEALEHAFAIAAPHLQAEAARGMAALPLGSRGPPWSWWVFADLGVLLTGDFNEPLHSPSSAPGAAATAGPAVELIRDAYQFELSDAAPAAYDNHRSWWMQWLGGTRSTTAAISDAAAQTLVEQYPATSYFRDAASGTAYGKAIDFMFVSNLRALTLPHGLSFAPEGGVDGRNKLRAIPYGDRAGDPTDIVWPSDHAALIADLAFWS